jgi:hypothetical protein
MPSEQRRVDLGSLRTAQHRDLERARVVGRRDRLFQIEARVTAIVVIEHQDAGLRRRVEHEIADVVRRQAARVLDVDRGGDARGQRRVEADRPARAGRQRHR